MSKEKTYLPETGLEIAIVGMAGRFPGADNLEQYWELNAKSEEAISYFKHSELHDLGGDTQRFADKNYVKARGRVNNAEYFDASFFNVAPRDAEMMDPQHRIFLEIAWSALEDAACDPDNYKGPIGVFAGAGFNSYLVMMLNRNPDFVNEENALQHLFNNDKDYIATRASYKLNLRGPSINVQSACSTSLVATHLASQSLISGESDVAIAGGIAIRVPQNSGYWYQRGSIFSPDGHCRAFDENAAGTVGGNGGGAVVLKRLETAIEDGDTIYAVIKASALNNDGDRKVGFTAPSVAGEASVIRTAQGLAEIDPKTIRYIEGHGSGTALGDPIEIEALTKAFGVAETHKQFCAVSSVKANIGHLDTGAGMAGLIRASLALHRGKIFPNANFKAANPRIDFAKSPFYVPTALTDWPEDSHSRRAGVSSFGIGGTNAHIVLEEAPQPTTAKPIDTARQQLIVLSAKTVSALKQRCRDLALYLSENPNTGLSDLAFTLQQGRKAFDQRCAVVADTPSQVAACLEHLHPKHLHYGQAPERAPDIVFMFSGQGAQYPNMAKALYTVEPVFQRHLDQCLRTLSHACDENLRALLFPSQPSLSEAQSRIQETQWAQPLLFSIEYALAKLLIHWGLKPHAMIGHSIGEYTAACIAGVMSLEDTLKIVAARGRLMQAMAPGDMLSVAQSEEALSGYLNDTVALAAVNAPNACVLAGPKEAIALLEKEFTDQDINCRRLRTSHAFHSPMMASAATAFKALIQKITFNAPHIPYMSNVTGTWITKRDVQNPEYWSEHLQSTVRFSEGINQLLDEKQACLIEVGPGNTLATLSRQCQNTEDKRQTPDNNSLPLSTLPHPKDETDAYQYLLNTVGKIWVAGIRPHWETLHHSQPTRLSLPTYPFERKRYWLDGESGVGEHENTGEDEHFFTGFAGAGNNPQGVAYIAPTNDIEWSIASIWQGLFGIEKIGIHHDFFDMGGDSMLAIQLVAQLQSFFEVELPLAEALQYPTVAEQASRIKEARQSGGKASSGSPLVRIQPKGTKPPFYCVHPAGGIVHCYIELARLLGKDQPFYALQHPGIDGPCEPYTDFTVMASHYIKAIKKHQPKGPYFIGGWSFGGTVAYEMAQQLIAGGDEVASLIMMDTPAPTSAYAENLLRDEFDSTGIFTFLGRGIGQIFGNNLSISPDKLDGLSTEEQFDMVLQQAGSVNEMSDSNEAREQLEQIIHMFKVADQAERQYQPQYYEGTVSMLRVNALDDYEFTGYKDHPGIKDAAFGWDNVAKSVAVTTVPGTHMTMVVNPHVRDLAKALSTCLDKACEVLTHEATAV